MAQILVNDIFPKLLRYIQEQRKLFPRFPYRVALTHVYLLSFF